MGQKGRFQVSGVRRSGWGNAEFRIQNCPSGPSPTYDLQHTTYEELTICIFNNITAFKAQLPLFSTTFPLCHRL